MNRHLKKLPETFDTDAADAAGDPAEPRTGTRRGTADACVGRHVARVP
jgi:hypothetical protein